MIRQEPSEAVAPEEGVIHIVDDEQDIVSIATIALEREGFKVHSFSNPSQALQDIEDVCKKKVKMLITDMRMPGHNGFEVAKRTRAVAPDVPIVFITAFEINMREYDKLFPSLKINAFLQKPFHIQQLVELAKTYGAKSQNSEGT